MLAPQRQTGENPLNVAFQTDALFETSLVLGASQVEKSEDPKPFLNLFRQPGLKPSGDKRPNTNGNSPWLQLGLEADPRETALAFTGFRSFLRKASTKHPSDYRRFVNPRREIYA